MGHAASVMFQKILLHIIASPALSGAAISDSTTRLLHCVSNDRLLEFISETLYQGAMGIGRQIYFYT